MTSKIPDYAFHNDTKISGFFGDYRFLSNFFYCPKGVFFSGLSYPSSENAYQAAKVVYSERYKFLYCSASESKKLWKTCEKIHSSGDEWDENKYQVMYKIVLQKFLRDPSLSKALLNTGEKHLEETNSWGDTFWGVNPNGHGENNLGKILMAVRTIIRDHHS